MQIQLLVVRDFDMWFENFTRKLFEKIDNPSIKNVVITTTQWKNSDVSFKFDSSEGRLFIDYYSVVRVFGWSFDTDELIETFNKLK